MGLMQHAALLAAKEIAQGADPDHLVHLLFYPEDYYLRDEEVMGLSSPITWQEWSKGGYTERYYRLGQLARM